MTPEQALAEVLEDMDIDLHGTRADRILAHLDEKGFVVLSTKELRHWRHSVEDANLVMRGITEDRNIVFRSGR